MNKLIVILTLLLAAFTIVLAQNSDQKSVAVTIYNNNLGVVKDIRTIDLQEGYSEISITDVAEQIDPTSVHIDFDGEVIEQNYQYDLVSLNKILERYIDKNVRMIDEQGNIIEGKLLSSLGGQAVIKKNDGTLVMLRISDKYRITVDDLPEGLITKPTLQWKINSNSGGEQDVEISYQTRGMRWSAEYVAVLNEDDTELALNAWVSIENNSGTTYKDADLKLVAGDVNLVTYANGKIRRDALMMAEAAKADRQFDEREFFEYHIYDLQRKSTIKNNENKQVSLFETDNVKATKKYLFKANSRNNNVGVYISFENKEEYGLGIPMPKGKIRMMKSDGNSVEFIGEDMIDHTPRNEKLELKIGNAFDLLGEERMTESKRLSDKVTQNSFEVKLTNRKSEDVVIEVERNLGLNWEVVDSSIDFEKKDARTILFKVPVKSDSEFTFDYTIRYNY